MTTASKHKPKPIKKLDARLSDEELAIQACDIDDLKEAIREIKAGKTIPLREIIARGKPRTVK